MKKKHAPRKQLIAAGKIATEELIKRGIISSECLTQEIMKDNPKLILPGIPSYIPHPWTLKASQRMMFNLLILWKNDNKDTPEKINKISLFIPYLIKEMKSIEQRAKKKQDLIPMLFKDKNDVATIAEIFSPVNQYQTTKGLTKFFVDSFAVSIIINGKVDDTTKYFTWFLDWTDTMYKVWTKKSDEKI